MNAAPWLLRIPARWLVPLLLFVFALLAIGLRYQYQTGTIEADVAEQEASRLRERLGTDQARLDQLMGLEDALAVRRVVGALALHGGVERAYLVDLQGTVQASLSRLDLGRPVAGVLAAQAVRGELDPLLSLPLPRPIDVERTADGSGLRALVPLQGEARLLVWQDLARPLLLRRVAVQDELTREALVVLLAVAGLALMLHLLWFRRARRLAQTLAAIGGGDLSIRTGLQGRDELAHIGLVADRMAEQLLQERSRLQHVNDLIDRSPAVVIEWRNEPSWPVIQVSGSVRQWGYEPQQLLDAQVQYSDLIHPDDRPRIHAEVERFFAHGPDDYRQEYRIRRADGGWGWVDDRTTLTRDADGQVARVSGVLLDVTAQKQAQQAQREQAELLRMFYELPFLGMAISSPGDKRWLQVNDRLCEILGYSREELLRMSWAEMTPPGDLERNVGLFDELVAGLRDGYRLAKRFVRKDGSTVFTEIDVKALRDADGRVRQLYATVQDLTERLQADADLRRLGAMADNASDALFLTVDGRFADCNAAAVRLFGYASRADFLGRSPAQMSPPVQADGRPSDVAAMDFLSRVMEDTPQRFDWWHQRADGTVFDAEVGLVRFHMDGGQPAVIGVVRDITERKAADVALRRSQELLLKAQDIGRMGSWSHELASGRFSWSQQTHEIHGTDPATFELSLDHVLQLLHPEDAGRVECVFNACVRELKPYDIHYRIRLPDGQVKHLHVKGEFEWVDGRPERIVGMVQDQTELVEAQRERDRLVTVMETTTDIVSMADAQSRVFYLNRAGYEVLGLAPGQLAPDAVARLQPEWARRLVQDEAWPAVLRDGRWLGETAICNAQGDEVPVSQLIMAHHDADGKVDHVWTLLRDLSQRKADEAALQLERSRLAEAQAVARIGNWSVELPAGAVSWSQQHFSVLGLDPAETQPSIDAYLSVVHPDDLARVRAHVERVTELAREGVAKIEHRIVTAQGVRHVEERASVERDAQGLVVRIFGTTMDVTERVLADLAARELRDMLEQAESVSLLGSWAADAQTQRLTVSAQLFRNLGLEPAARPPSEQEYLDRLHPEDRARVAQDMTSIRQGGPGADMVFRTNPAHGPVRWLRRTAQRVDRSAEGLMPRYIGTLLDITETVEAEEQLRQANQALEQRVTERTTQLRQANQELEAFSYTVSHDLKAPLRGIDGYSQLLVEEFGDRLDDDGRQFVQRIRHGVQLMGDLINDLLEYSRMERRDMARDPVALAPLVQQVLDGYEADIRRQGARVQIDLEPFTLALDREGIAVVLRNLIGNALKFSRDSRPSLVEIGSRSEAGQRILWVRDNGVGFDMKYHDRMFGIFQRLHRAEEFPGTGVGLALVSKAVQRMGGRVWAESALGTGASFFLEFPE